ncbi:protein endosperm defective 1 [Phtheirospermum japonicum]|uniref:Protein endosperm defective 1 n=1 Tax=Phtheirospermum japonicum TaxID=374723 RepID=A0A830D5X9_9LAMI|nr:protein endosperm defective 1 [Phtheirospermum japonicum]
MSDQTGGAATTSTTEAPPLPQRRPRVREVSSRFMSPLTQSNSTPNTSDLRRSKSAHRRQTDENLIPEPNRISDKPSIASPVPTAHKRQHHHQRVKQQNSENGESNSHPNSDVRVSSRPDTPIVVGGSERIVPSRYRQVPNSIRRSISLNSISSSGCPSTAAARLLQEATSDEQVQQLSRVSSSSSSDSCSTTASSCPDSNESSGNSTGGDCARPLNFSISRPPHHPSTCLRTGLDARKGIRKVISHQEDVHSLKMLSNHYLQWRFANAKAEACVRAQKHEAQRKFWSLGSKISDIRDHVKKKRHEFGVLRGIKTLTTIVEAQMPYLDKWSTLEEDYSNSLSATTNTLLSASLRLPVSTEVRVDARQLGEALNSALKVVELLSSHIQRFIHKAEEMNISISELAKMVSEEKARIDECGHMLSKTYTSQVKECSVRGTLMQLHHCSHHQPQKSEATV